MEGVFVAFQSLLTIKTGTSPFRSFYNSFDTKCPSLKEKKIIHCAHIALYLGSAIRLPMIPKKAFFSENAEKRFFSESRGEGLQIFRRVTNASPRHN